MSGFLVPNDGIEDIDGDDNFIPSFTGRDGTIYLIDASIFEDVEQFRLCLDCIEADLLKIILQNPKDLVSVVFYNTQNSPPPNEQFDVDDTTTNIPANCAVFIPVKPISKILIQYFKNFRESEDFFGFAQKYGVSNGSCFSEALWLCSRIIIRCNYKLMFSKIILFTNNEQPHMLNTPEEQQALVRAKDLYDNNICVDVVPMVDQFDFEPFYKEFLCTVENLDADDLRYHDPVNKRLEMLNRIYRINYRKSCLRHLNFELADDISMSCDVYSFSRSHKKPYAVKMFRENKELVTTKRSYYTSEQNPEDESTVEHKVLTNQLYKCQNICGKEILFSPDELVAIKTIFKPSLRLLGFKPLDKLKRMTIKKSLFLYPNEKDIGGSTLLFRALWEKCLEKEKYALCIITMRAATPPKYVALVPQSVEKHGNDGFEIRFLPVTTSIGALNSIVNTLPEPTPEQTSLLEKICKKLKFKYNNQTFSNPALNAFFANLEAIVYDEEVQEMEDLTMPDLNFLDATIECFVPSIEKEFGSEEASSSRSKRPNYGTQDGEACSKAPKKDLSSGDIEQAIRDGRMAAVTVQHLKDFIRSKNAHHPSTAVKKNLFEIAQKLID